jgi:hypothetical protein
MLGHHNFCAKNCVKPGIHVLYETFVYGLVFGQSDGAVNGHVTGHYRVEIQAYSNRLLAGPISRPQYANCMALDGPCLTWASIRLLGYQLAT